MQALLRCRWQQCIVAWLLVARWQSADSQPSPAVSHKSEQVRLAKNVYGSSSNAIIPGALEPSETTFKMSHRTDDHLSVDALQDVAMLT
jgi:hypothetical protein